MGYIREGVFYPSGSVAKYFFNKQRTFNKQAKENITNVYFIQAKSGGPVKIGSAGNIHSRLESIQANCPVKLQVIKTYNDVNKREEFAFHEKYKKYRLHGEWFDPIILKKEEANSVK